MKFEIKKTIILWCTTWILGGQGRNMSSFLIFLLFSQFFLISFLNLVLWSCPSNQEYLQTVYHDHLQTYFLSISIQIRQSNLYLFWKLINQPSTCTIFISSYITCIKEKNHTNYRFASQMWFVKVNNITARYIISERW